MSFEGTLLGLVVQSFFGLVLSYHQCHSALPEGIGVGHYTLIRLHQLPLPHGEAEAPRYLRDRKPGIFTDSSEPGVHLHGGPRARA